MTSEQETKRLAREASRLDKECPPAIYVALHCGCIATYGEHPTQGRANLKYIRSDLAKQREAELLEVLNLIVDRKWSIASPIHARPDNEDEATHLMCSIEKQAIDKARAILAKHKAEGREGS